MKAFISALVLSAFSVSTVSACEPGRAELRGEFGSASFTVELADEPEERSQGLMHRESMAASAGMLFIYERPQRATFWMRNTLIPLDMIFLNDEGVITRIHENAVPLDETTIDGGPNVLAVLEINAGLSGALGLSVGDELRHEAMPQNLASWMCG